MRPGIPSLRLVADRPIQQLAALLVALAALGFWALAALVAAAGIAIWHDEGAGATAALFGIAAVSPYPAWLLSARQ
jgi:hypothetical protein